MYFWLKKNIGEIYYILPYIGVIQNKLGLILDIVFHRDEFKIQLKNGGKITLKRKQFTTLINLLGVVSFATSCLKLLDNKIELSFDTKNKFVISLDNLSLEDEKLLALLYGGTLFGTNFITSKTNGLTITDKTLRIEDSNNKKIVETADGLKFYLDSITPGIIVEAFIQRIHDVDSTDLHDKIVVDVGAECGDTAIYYASKGARVYAFEPIKAHYDAMIRNISLNPQLSHLIKPINAAIGKDGMLRFYQSDRGEVAEQASFVYNVHGKDARISEVKGYSLYSAFSEFDIKKVDLLKMDCKGCEFFLTDNDLKNVERVKIEYWAYDENHKLVDLLALLTKNGFQYIIYRHTIGYYTSNLIDAVIYAKKF